MSGRDRLARLARLRAIDVRATARALGAHHAEAVRATRSLARIDALLGSLKITPRQAFGHDLAADAGQRARLHAARNTAYALADRALRQAEVAERVARFARARADAVDRFRSARSLAHAQSAERNERENAPAAVARGIGIGITSAQSACSAARDTKPW